jgi:hypothetical protein
MLFLQSLVISNKKLSFLLINFVSIIIFTFIYWYLGTKEHFKFVTESNDSNLDFIDALYYSTTSHCTLGFGDIAPKSKLTRLLTIVQVFITMSYLLLATI